MLSPPSSRSNAVKGSSCKCRRWHRKPHPQETSGCSREWVGSGWQDYLSARWKSACTRGCWLVLGGILRHRLLLLVRQRLGARLQVESRVYSRHFERFLDFSSFKSTGLGHLCVLFDWPPPASKVAGISLEFLLGFQQIVSVRGGSVFLCDWFDQQVVIFQHHLRQEIRCSELLWCCVSSLLVDFFLRQSFVQSVRLDWLWIGFVQLFGLIFDILYSNLLWNVRG